MLRGSTGVVIPPSVSPALLYEITARVLAEITPCKCEPIAPTSAVALSGWQGVVEYQGPSAGRIGLRVPSAFARILATSMAGEEVGDDLEMHADAVGESANILSSSVLAILFGTRKKVQVSSPHVTSGRSEFPRGDAEGTVMLGLLIDKEHVVQVWVQVAAGRRNGGGL